MKTIAMPPEVHRRLLEESSHKLSRINRTLGLRSQNGPASDADIRARTEADNILLHREKDHLEQLIACLN